MEEPHGQGHDDRVQEVPTAGVVAPAQVLEQLWTLLLQRHQEHDQSGDTQGGWGERWIHRGLDGWMNLMKMKSAVHHGIYFMVHYGYKYSALCR